VGTILIALALALGLFLSAASNAQSAITLVATGSSMPEPLYLAWADAYHETHPDVQIRYLAVGTAESAHRILLRTGDFGGGDAPIPEKELKSATVPVLELPSVLIGIVAVYNLPALKEDLRLSGPVLANIFLGKITEWNDPEIEKLNPNAKLPNLPISVVHRTEGKGSSYILTDYLSKVSPEFQKRVGRSVSPNWPAGVAAGRTQDMLDRVKGKLGAIGYTELNWAAQSGLRMARIRNVTGEFAAASDDSIAAAATASEAKMGNDFRVSLTNAPGKESYPISSFTWLYVPAAAQDTTRGSAVNQYLMWVYSDGQRIAKTRGYAPLPATILAKVRVKAATVR
jgi:phosphate transport system substrate-binding protein